MKKIILMFSIFLISSQISSAQRRYVRDAIERNMEKKYEKDREKGYNAVDERLDKLDETDKEKRAKVQPFEPMSFEMEIEYPDRPKDNGTIQYYFKNYECSFVFKTAQGNSSTDRMIMNYKEGKSTTLMTDKKGKKTGMVMEMKNYDWIINYAVDKNTKMLEDDDATIKKTDEYKTIEGYKCRKFIYEDYTNTIEYWVSNSIDMKYVRMNQAAFNNLYTGRKKTNENPYQKVGMNGLIIQTHILPKNSRNEESIITMKNIKFGNVPDGVFSTEGYEIATMPSLRDIWKSANERE